jgi:mono/diheme cytochrome c family protein
MKALKKMMRMSRLWLPIFLFAAFACKESKQTESTLTELGQVSQDLNTADAKEAMEARGAYLVGIIGCADCHTPKKMTEQGPVPDMDRYMMGFDASRPLPPVPDKVPIGPWVLFSGELTAAVGPWGTSYAGNLTPHETGIGNWTFENFRSALKEGKYKGLENSRPLMPPMPVEAYRNLSDEDVRAIFSYLKTIKPIDNLVPAYQPPSS